MRLIDSIVWAFEKYKEKPVESIINSILLDLVGLVTFIPFVGGFVAAYLEPIILKRIAKDYGLETTEDLSVPRKALMLIKGIPILLFWIILIFMGFSLIKALSKGLTVIKVFLGLGMGILVVILIALVFSLLYTYSVYGGVLGKVSSLEINVRNSFLLLVLGIVISIIFEIVSLVLGLIPWIGGALSLLLKVLVLPVFAAAALLKYASEL